MQKSTRFAAVLILTLVSLELLFVILDLTVNWLKWSEHGPIRRLFNITREDGLASLFAIVQTLAVAILAWLVLLLTSRSQAPQNLVRGWLIIALFFTYMAIDDGALVHERIGTVFKNSNEEADLPSYGWQAILAPVFILFGLYLFQFLFRHYTDRTHRLLLIGALGCLATAMGMDFLEGAENGYAWLWDSTGWREKTIIHFSKSVEEFLEMLGMTLFLLMLLRRLERLTWETEITVGKGRVAFRPATRDHSGD